MYKTSLCFKRNLCCTAAAADGPSSILFSSTLKNLLNQAFAVVFDWSWYIRLRNWSRNFYRCKKHDEGTEIFSSCRLSASFTRQLTGYSLGDLGIEVPWCRDFLYPSKPSLGITQPPVQLLSVPFPVDEADHSHLAQKLNIRATLLLRTCACFACSKTKLVST